MIHIVSVLYSYYADSYQKLIVIRSFYSVTHE